MTKAPVRGSMYVCSPRCTASSCTLIHGSAGLVVTTQNSRSKCISPGGDNKNFYRIESTEIETRYRDAQKKANAHAPPQRPAYAQKKASKKARKKASVTCVKKRGPRPRRHLHTTLADVYSLAHVGPCHTRTAVDTCT